MECEGLLLEYQNKATASGFDRSVRKGGFRNAIITEVAILLAVGGYGKVLQIDVNGSLKVATPSGRFVSFCRRYVCHFSESK